MLAAEKIIAIYRERIHMAQSQRLENHEYFRIEENCEGRGIFNP